MPFHYSVDLRKKALEAFERGERKVSICRMLGLSRPTLDRWIALWKKNGSLEPRPYPGAARRFCREQLREDVLARPDDTLKERAQRFSVSACALSKALRAMGFTHKKKFSFQGAGRGTEAGF